MPIWQEISIIQSFWYFPGEFKLIYLNPYNSASRQVTSTAVAPHRVLVLFSHSKTEVTSRRSWADAHSSTSKVTFPQYQREIFHPWLLSESQQFHWEMQTSQEEFPSFDLSSRLFVPCPNTRLLKDDSGVHKTWHQLESKTLTLLTNIFALGSLEPFPALREMCCWKFSFLLQVFSLFNPHRTTSRSQVSYFGRGAWTTLTTAIATCYLMLQFIILYIPEGLGLVPSCHRICATSEQQIPFSPHLHST